MTRACRRLPTILNTVGAAACLVLGACGGGGGGSTAPGGGSAPPATTAATLVFGNDHASAPMRAVKATEQMMAFAQFVTDMTGRFVRKGSPLTAVTTCANHIGSASLTLTDRDGDGVASKGDRLAIVATGCKTGGMFDTITGDIAIELGGATAVSAGTVEGDVQLGSRVTGNPGRVWGGGFHTLQSRTTVGKSWRITTPGGVSFTFTGTSQSTAADTLRGVDFTKNVNYETAQSTITLAMVFDTVAGTISVSTPAPVAGYLQRPPDTGEVQFQGANGAVRLTTVRSGSGWDVRFILNAAGSDRSSQNYPWGSLTDGIMWWDGLRRVDRTDVDADTQEYAADALRVEVATPPPDLMTAADAVYQVQFLRPPIDLPALEYRFDDVSGYGGPGWNVAATAERHGAAILLRPAESLRQGRVYAITATLNGAPWTVLSPVNNSGRLLHDAQGHELNLTTFGAVSAPLALITTIGTSATSMASVAEKITLTAITQPANGVNVTAARYHWSQVNGTPLRFSDPDAAVTTVSLGDIRASGVETVQLQLTVTDSLGAPATERTTITVGDLVGRTSRMWVRGLPYRNGAPLSLEQPIAFTPSYVPTRYTDQFRDLYQVPNELWDVQFGLPPGTLFAPGSYTYGGAGAALAGNAPDMILQNPREAACVARSGQFTVLDAGYGADGAPVRLAIDFTISCNGGPQLFGNYRHNSSIPTLDTRTAN